MNIRILKRAMDCIYVNTNYDQHGNPVSSQDRQNAQVMDEILQVLFEYQMETEETIE